MKILNFGSCNLDYVYTMDHIVAPGETEATDAFEIFPGGKGLNQSIAAAKGGAEVYHAGCIGRDGGPLRDIMAKSGVNLSYLKEVDLPNGHAVIQVSRKGENSIFLFAGSNNAVTEEQIDAVLSEFSAGDLLLLQNEINLVPYLVQKGYERGMQIVLNPSPFNEKIAEIDFSCLSYLLLNEVEGKALTGSDDPRECIGLLRKRYPALSVVLTLGKDGCVFCGGKDLLYQSAFRVPTVDTTAAGDTFTGYFLASLAEGLPVEVCLRRASAASALAVSRKGAAPSIPYREEVLEALPDLKPLRERTDGRDEQKKVIVAYLESHLKDASLKGLSQVLGYSEAYTGNYVKKCFAQPFSKVLQRVRCGVAAKELTETDASVEEIIYRVGYQNESFFRKAFRERYGVTPLAYRKQREENHHDV